MNASTRVGRGRRRARLALLALTTALTTSEVLAQTAPPPYSNVDEFGVDLTTGQYTFSMTEGVIGSGPGTLALHRTYVGGIAVDNWSGGAYQTDYNGVSVMKVEFGRISDSFGIAGSSYTATKQDGASLTATANGFLYRGRDGTEVQFASTMPTAAGQSNVRGFSCRPQDALGCSIPVSRRDPSGMTYTYSWDVDEACLVLVQGDCETAIAHYRLASVSSSAGYTMRFRYASNIQGIGKNGPPAAWRRTVGVDFYNYALSTNPQSSVSYTYPSPGVMQLVDMGGRTWQFTTGGNGLVGVQRPGMAANNPSIAYATNGLAVTLDGVTANYSIAGGTISRTDPAGRTRTVVSDPTTGRPLSDTLSGGGLSSATSFAYDSGGRLLSETRPEGDKTEYEYDPRGNLRIARSVAKPNSGLTAIELKAGFASSCTNPVICNRPEWTEDALGNRTVYDYDPIHGGVTKVIRPAVSGVSPETIMSYAQTSGVYLPTAIRACASTATCTGSAAESVTEFAYDAKLNLTTHTMRAGDNSLISTTTASHDAIGNLLSVDGPLPGAADTTTYRYDASRNLVGVITADPDGGGALSRRAVKTTFNASEQPTVVETGTVTDTTNNAWAAFAPAQQSAATYDANARKVQDTLSAGGSTYAVTQYSHDSLGRPDCAATRMNPAAWGSLPASACTLGTAGSHGPDRIVKASYDAVGRRTGTQSAHGVAGVQSDDATVAFTPNGQVASVIDAEGNKTSYEYDGHDRLVRTFYPSTIQGAGTSSTTDYEELTYDAGGNVTARRLRDGQTITYGHDALGRMIERTLPNGWSGAGGAPWVQTYHYDNLGRLLLVNDPHSAQASFGWDALGRKVSEGGFVGGVRGFAYDVAGRLTGQTWPGGLAVSFDHLVTGEVTAVRENGATAGLGVLATYAYDDLGRRTGVMRGNGTTTSYGYDPVSRLGALGHDLAGTGADLSVGFTYNPAGQIATRTASNDAYAFAFANQNAASTINGLNQATAVGGVSIGHNARGNIANIGSLSYGYSAANALTLFDGGYVYWDALGRRLDINVEQRWSLYDGDRVVEEFGYDQTVKHRYVHIPGEAAPLVWYEGSGTTDRRWLHADERGSVIAVSDASGAALAINRYDEHGQPAAGNLGRFGYTGQQWIAGLGLWDYKARMYHPGLGRFPQPDPIGYGDGMNLYGYVGGDPVNRVDPTGLVAQAPGGPCPPPADHVTGDIIVCGSSGGGGRALPAFAWFANPSFPIRSGPSFADGGDGAPAPGAAPEPMSQNAQCPAVNPGNIGNRTEIGNAMTRPGWQVINAKRAAEISRGRAAANFPASQLWNGRGDAWRHFRWNFSMAQSMGSRAASAFANAHEVSGQNVPAELAMDLHNNAMGRAFAESPATKGMTPDAAANLALRSGCLQTAPK